MSKIQLIKGTFEEQLELQFAPGIKAGFPSPAQDYLRESLDFNRDLIAHPEATFYGKVDGDSMEDAGINDGDIAVIDRSAELRNDIEKSGLKKEQRSKNKKTGARRESRSLFSSIYFVLFPNLRTCP